MAAKFLENKNFKQFYATPLKGNFSLDSNPVAWENCREQFAAKFHENITGFYFSHAPDKGDDIAEFLTKFENVINVPNTCFSKTNRSFAIWIEPASFWRNCEIKRSLLTIILRAAANYDKNKDNFDDALFNPLFSDNQYIRETKLAIMRFMFGFTSFTGNYKNIPSATVHKNGWREEFQYADEPSIRRLLVKPTKEKEISTLIGLDTLWL